MKGIRVKMLRQKKQKVGAIQRETETKTRKLGSKLYLVDWFSVPLFPFFAAVIDQV